MFDHDTGALKYDVDLNSLPNVYIDGFEFVVYFKALDDSLFMFNNQQTFYTDSNGLEMQERKLNYRSYYNITEDMYSHVNSNITANMYPINSAISIKDEKLGW